MHFESFKMHSVLKSVAVDRKIWHSRICDCRSGFLKVVRACFKLKDETTNRSKIILMKSNMETLKKLRFKQYQTVDTLAVHTLAKKSGQCI